MTEKNKSPEIRFKGFNNDWEEYALGELSESFEYGLNAAATKYDGINKYIRITDIDEATHMLKNNNLTSPNTDLSLAENYQLKLGDVLFARTGASVGKTYIYKEDDGLVYYAGFLIRARIKQKVNAEFVFQNTLTTEYDRFIRLTSQRSGQPGVNAQEYSELSIMIPKIDEQSKISTFFKNIDHNITLNQSKHDKLVNVKKAMLEKMFPRNGADVPEIRFKGFSEAWEERKLKEICILITKGTTPLAKLGNGSINFIKIENINKLSGKIAITTRIAKEEHENYLKRSQLKENDILFSIAGTLGRITIVNKDILPANTNQALAIIRLKEECLDYITTYLKGKTVSDYIRKNPTVGAQPNLSLEQIENIELLLPNQVEQTKIGNFFKNLDNLLTLHQSELEKLKNIKKSMLEKMFV